MKQSEENQEIRYIIAEHEPLTASYLVSLLREVRPRYILDSVIEEAEEAIRHYTSGNAGLLIYDLGLPDAREAQHVCGILAEKPVIFISDYDSVTDTLPSSVATRVLLKPISKTDIRRTLSAIESSSIQ